MTTGQMIATAAAAGARVAADWRRSVDSLINVCVGIRSGVLDFEKDKALLDAFLAPLIECGVLTAEEAKLGRSGSKLSMLIQIGEHAQLLRHDEVSRHLLAGYTIVYQTCVIYKNLPGGELQKVQELVRILAACPEDGARKYLLAATRHLKRNQSAPKGMGKADAQVAVEPPARTSLHELIEAGQRFDLVVLTPGKELSLLGEDYPDDPMQEESTLECSLPIHRIVNDDAALVVAARECELPVVVNKLLDLCGFDRPCDILLVQPVTSRKITEAEILVIAKRGRARVDLPEGAWLGDKHALQPLEVAGQLCPDANRRLHLFASAQSQGWCCVPSDDAWLERPSVR
jgi:hypothetical protein